MKYADMHILLPLHPLEMTYLLLLEAKPDFESGG